MACDLCDSCDDTKGHDCDPTGGKYCGHADSCGCSEPEAPDPPSCDKGGSDVDCDPDAKIRQLEETVETSTAEAAEAQETLDKLTKLRDQFNAALEQFTGDAENRTKRKADCAEFVKCKRPTVPDGVEACVDEQIEKVCAYVRALEEWARYLNWAAGNAAQRVRWQQWEYDRLRSHYDGLRDLATKCHAQCEDARKKYDEACASGDVRLTYLYWKIAKELGVRAEECCGDYDGKLCDAFEALGDAAKALGDAKRKESKLSAELQTVKKQLDEFSKQDYVWSRIARLVSSCCECDHDSTTDDESHKQHEHTC